MDESSAEASPLHIAVIVAGTNEPSNSNTLADAMIEGMKKDHPGMIVNKVRLKDMHIDHFEIGLYSHDHPSDHMKMIKPLILEADGVVIATPMWNFSIPAHLKNLIDRMGAFALDETHTIGTLKGKPFFFIVTAGMPSVAWKFLKHAMSHVPISIQYFGGSVLGTHFEGSCTLGKGMFGLVVDTRPKSLEAVRYKGAKFAAKVERFRLTGHLPWKYILIKKFVRLSQQIKKKLGL